MFFAEAILYQLRYKHEGSKHISLIQEGFTTQILQSFPKSVISQKWTLPVQLCMNKISLWHGLHYCKYE